MRVLIACEYSGIVRDAFLARGHEAWSCDLLPCERDATRHLQRDVREVLRESWDLVIAHPPCTHLAVSGARWLTRHFVAKKNGPDMHEGVRGYWHDPAAKLEAQKEAVEFVRELWACSAQRMAIENPISRLSTLWQRPTQIIQPWQFGHGETKATCLWLRGLPPLVPTDVVSGREGRVHAMPPSADRWKERSRTFTGIAAAMASQWG